MQTAPQPPSRARRLLPALLLVIGLAAGSEARPADTLVDAWIAWQGEQVEPIHWGYSFALRGRDAESLARQRGRLIAELETVQRSMQASGRAAVDGLGEWIHTLEAMDPLAARSPERLDLPWLAADLRRSPATARLRHMGHCQPPDWIELGSPDGTQRIAWEPDTTLTGLLAAAPRSATRRIDHAAVVTPLGEIHEFGVAAWNREDTALAPGSRILLLLPDSGLGGTLEGSLLNERLPRFLATRLPGDDCQLRPIP